MSRFLTAQEVAERWSVKDKYVYGLGRMGSLPRVVLPGEVVRFPEDAVEAFEAAHLQQGVSGRLAGRRRSPEPQTPERF